MPTLVSCADALDVGRLSALRAKVFTLDLDLDLDRSVLVQAERAKKEEGCVWVCGCVEGL